MYEQTVRGKVIIQGHIPWHKIHTKMSIHITYTNCTIGEGIPLWKFMRWVSAFVARYNKLCLSQNIYSGKFGTYVRKIKQNIFRFLLGINF